MSTKKHIVVCIPSLCGGGAERFVVTLLRHLDRRKFVLTLVVIDMHNAVFRNDIPDDVECIDLATSRIRYALPKIIATLWKKKPDVVFSVLGHLNVALSLVRFLLPRKARYIAREAIIVSRVLPSYRFPKIWDFIYRRIYKRYGLVVCVSRDMQVDLIKNYQFSAKRLVCIHNPVDVVSMQHYARMPITQPCFADGCIRLVAAGRLADQKGFDILIEAMALLNNPKLHVCILGQGELQATLSTLVHAKGLEKRITFVGFQSNPYAWFAQADAFILSSFYEGCSNVVLEALACGTPVIATPASGVREILDTITQCVVAQAITPDALAQAIDTWLMGPRTRVAQSAIQPYRVEHIVSQYERLFA